MARVITISALGDNFIYLCPYDQRHAFVVDPGESSPVLRRLNQNGLSLTFILITHHHGDHVAGLVELKKKTGCRVIGSDRERIPGIDRLVDGGQTLRMGNATIEVIATPGHTRNAVCYYMQSSSDNKNGILWTGDTLFVCGCGRLIECDAATMAKSLQKLASLPDQTLVYCGHDYTVENLKFAAGIEPDNQAIRQRLQQVRNTEQAGKPTVPSTILQERQTNPFLRADVPQVKAALDMSQAEAVEVFAELRRRKDIYG